MSLKLKKVMFDIIHKKGYLNKKAVTLVELVVVITILTILPLVGFYVYTSNIIDSRDANRINQLNSIYDAMRYYKGSRELPLPDNYVEVKVNGTTIAYQGYVGQNALTTVGYRGKIDMTLDPKDRKYYTYYVTKDRRFFELMTYLENRNNLKVSLLDSVYADGIMYVDRYPYMIGDKLGILTESGTNNPIQEVESVKSLGYIDFTGGLVGNYALNIKSEDIFVSSDNVVIGDKIKELTKTESTALLGSNDLNICGSEISDLNGEDTSVGNPKYLPTYNWTRSDTPGICTWNCVSNYNWDGTFCGLNCSVPINDIYNSRLYDISDLSDVPHSLSSIRSGINEFGISPANGTLTATFSYSCNDGTLTKTNSVNGIATCSAGYTFNGSWGSPACNPNPYTITFNSNGGVAATPATKLVTFNTQVGALSTTSRAGYTFNGWFTASLGGTQIQTTTVYTTVGDSTYYGQWGLNGVCGGADGVPTSTTPVALCNAGTPSGVTSGNTDYTWTCNGLNGGTTANCSAQRLYVVTFDGNGGAGHTPTAKNIAYNTVVGALPIDPTRTGYTFNGWWTLPSGGTQITTADLITANVTFYAQWILNTYTVSGSFGIKAAGATINGCGYITTADASGNFSIPGVSHFTVCNNFIATRVYYTCTTSVNGPASLAGTYNSVAGSCTETLYTVNYNGNSGITECPTGTQVYDDTGVYPLPTVVDYATRTILNYTTYLRIRWTSGSYRYVNIYPSADSFYCKI